MHYHVITKHHERSYRGRTEWITSWEVEVVRDNGSTYTLHFGGRLCFKRGLQKLDQEIDSKRQAEAARRQAEAKKRAATLKKRHTKTWWGLIDNRTGKVVKPD